MRIQDLTFLNGGLELLSSSDKVLEQANFIILSDNLKNLTAQQFHEVLIRLAKCVNLKYINISNIGSGYLPGMYSTLSKLPKLTTVVMRRCRDAVLSVSSYFTKELTVVNEYSLPYILPNKFVGWALRDQLTEEEWLEQLLLGVTLSRKYPTIPKFSRKRFEVPYSIFIADGKPYLRVPLQLMPREIAEYNQNNKKMNEPRRIKMVFTLINRGGQLSIQPMLIKIGIVNENTRLYSANEVNYYIDAATIQRPCKLYTVVPFAEAINGNVLLSTPLSVMQAEQVSLSLLLAVLLDLTFKGLVHCDLKPGNVVFNSSFTVGKIIDLESVAFCDYDAQLKIKKYRITKEYCAPEMRRDADGNINVSHDTDAYAVGRFISEIFDNCRGHAVSCDDKDVVAKFLEVKQGLLDNEPSERWSLLEAITYIRKNRTISYNNAITCRYEDELENLNSLLENNQALKTWINNTFGSYVATGGMPISVEDIISIQLIANLIKMLTIVYPTLDEKLLDAHQNIIREIKEIKENQNYNLANVSKLYKKIQVQEKIFLAERQIANQLILDGVKHSIKSFKLDHKNKSVLEEMLWLHNKMVSLYFDGHAIYDIYQFAWKWLCHVLAGYRKNVESNEEFIQYWRKIIKNFQLEHLTKNIIIDTDWIDVAPDICIADIKRFYTSRELEVVADTIVNDEKDKAGLLSFLPFYACKGIKGIEMLLSVGMPGLGFAVATKNLINVKFFLHAGMDSLAIYPEGVPLDIAFSWDLISDIEKKILSVLLTQAIRDHNALCLQKFVIIALNKRSEFLDIILTFMRHKNILLKYKPTILDFLEKNFTKISSDTILTLVKNGINPMSKIKPVRPIESPFRRASLFPFLSPYISQSDKSILMLVFESENYDLALDIIKTIIVTNEGTRAELGLHLVIVAASESLNFDQKKQLIDALIKVGARQDIAHPESRHKGKFYHYFINRDIIQLEQQLPKLKCIPG